MLTIRAKKTILSPCEEWTASQKVSPQLFSIWGIVRRGENPQSDTNFFLTISQK